MEAERDRSAEGGNGGSSRAREVQPVGSSNVAPGIPAGAAPDALACYRPTTTPAHGRSQPLARRLPKLFLPVAVLAIFAVVMVGGDVLERRLFPDLPIGRRHALLTLRAGIVTALACLFIYETMRRQQKRLSVAAAKLTHLLASYQEQPAEPERFENPHLVPCDEALGCRREDGVMHGTAYGRCWQVVALTRAAGNHQAPRIELQQCLACEVYRRSCPDQLTELGEAFNNLMFLLETEARQATQMRAQMVEKAKMVALGQIAAGVAHEVGNPLSSISSIVQMLKRSSAGDTMTEQLNLIHTHIQRITTTVRRLDSLARPAEESWKLVDLAQTLSEVVRLVSFDPRAQSVVITCDGPKMLPPTYSLRGQLQQVFINLALNALDAMPEGGHLTFRGRVRHGNIVVQVEDTGCGIAPETDRRVFEPFVTTKEPGRGPGLGLAVSYGIVQNHGGTIDFASTPGKGTVFTVEIPIMVKAPEPEHAQEHHSVGGR